MFMPGEEVIREVLLKEEQELWEILIRGRSRVAGIWVRLGEKMICACDKVSLLAYTTEEAGGFVGCTIECTRLRMELTVKIMRIM